MNPDEMKRYRCRKNHVIGLIRWDGHGASRLLLLRESLDESALNAQAPEVAAIIDSGDVTCSICGDSLVWVPSVPALIRLLRRHKKLLDGLRALTPAQAPAESGFANPAFLE
jgi:hypothetical protein